MDTQNITSVGVTLPVYFSVQTLILRYSSWLKLENGIKFRVCNVCSKRLDSGLSKQHNEHLKGHHRAWKQYMEKLGELLKTSIDNANRKDQTKIEAENKETDDDKSSTTDSEEERNVYNVVDSLQHSLPGPPPMTTFEKIFKRKFTYDDNPIRAYREFSDLEVIAMSNNTKRRQIDKLIGEGI